MSEKIRFINHYFNKTFTSMCLNLMYCLLFSHAGVCHLMNAA